MPTLAHRCRDGTVDAHHRQEQCRPAEHYEKGRAERAVGGRTDADSLEGAHIEDRSTSGGRSHFALGDCLIVLPSLVANQPRDLPILLSVRHLGQRDVDRGPGLLRHRQAVTDVGDDTNDGTSRVFSSGAVPGNS